MTPNKAKQIVYSALGETSEDYEGDWANEPLARSQAGESKSEDSPDISEQLEKQIAKAAAEHDDSVVAVMKEVRSLLKNFERGFTKDPERGIIKNGDWVEEDHPRGDDGKFIESGGTSSNSSDYRYEYNVTDSEGKPYERPRLRLPKDEYGKVMHSISTLHYPKYDGKTQGFLYDTELKAKYYFEIHGFNEYNIYRKDYDDDL